MKTSKAFQMFFMMAIVIGTIGCAKGPKGDQGAPGAGKVRSTMNCSGTISGLSGSQSALNGISIDYNAVLTTSGDVYATTDIDDGAAQTSGTQFYAATEAGAQTAEVLVTDDFYGTANGGYWSVSLNRTTLVTSVVYTDAGLGSASPVNLQFTSSACSVGNF